MLLTPLLLLTLVTDSHRAFAHSPPARTVLLTPAPGAAATTLTSENLTLATRDEEPWILMMEGGGGGFESLAKSFEILASNWRGVVRCGIVGVDATVENFSSPSRVFRILPFGSPSVKATQFFDTDVMESALDFAVASLTDEDIARVESRADLEALVRLGLSAKPPKLTAVFTIRDATPTPHQRSLSKKLKSAFAFGLVPRAESVDFLGVADFQVPGLLVFFVDADGVAAVSLRDSGLADVEESVGRFHESFRFLVEANREFRRRLPGWSSGFDDEKFVSLSDALNRAKSQFTVVDFNEAKKEEL